MDRLPVPPVPFLTCRAQRASSLALECHSASPSSRRVEVARRERAPGLRAGACVAAQGHALAAAQLPVGARRGRPPGAARALPALLTGFMWGWPACGCNAQRACTAAARHQPAMRPARAGPAGAGQSGWRSACGLGRRAAVLKGAPVRRVAGVCGHPGDQRDVCRAHGRDLLAAGAQPEGRDHPRAVPAGAPPLRPPLPAQCSPSVQLSRARSPLLPARVCSCPSLFSDRIIIVMYAVPAYSRCMQASWQQAHARTEDAVLRRLSCSRVWLAGCGRSHQSSS